MFRTCVQACGSRLSCSRWLDTVNWGVCCTWYPIDDVAGLLKKLGMLRAATNYLQHCLWRCQYLGDLWHNLRCCNADVIIKQSLALSWSWSRTDTLIVTPADVVHSWVAVVHELRLQMPEHMQLQKSGSAQLQHTVCGNRVAAAWLSRMALC